MMVYDLFRVTNIHQPVTVIKHDWNHVLFNGCFEDIPVWYLNLEIADIHANSSIEGTASIIITTV